MGETALGYKNITAKPVMTVTADTALDHHAKDSPPQAKAWDIDMDVQTQSAIDRVLEHLVRHGLRPNVSMTGDMIAIVTAIVEEMKRALPDAMHADLKLMMDHLAHWLCDYAQETGTKKMKIVFGFGASLANNHWEEA